MLPNSMRTAGVIGPASLLIAALLACDARAEEASLGLKVPEGFRVELYADDALAHDIYSMTFDSRGRVVVSGKNYVKILRDDDGDGRADRATLFSNLPKSGAHGLVFDGDDLLCTGDGALMRLRDKDGDGRADGPPEILAKLNNPEHGANGLTRGPDGWFYLACGNDAGVTAELATTKTSPVTRPQCGAIVRFSPDGRQSEIVAHGFRNIYDLDFDEHGALFTVDSDGERDQYLPWYSPTRVFDVATGQHHGWVQRGWQHSWNRPEYFCDSMTRAAELGRGSPTGVCVYRHRQFPSKYQGALFSCCWTLGRVYALRPVPLISPQTAAVKEGVFLETSGETGFAPVDVAVGPAGDLFVAIGGRQTRGGVFRVTYVGPDARSTPPPASDLDRLLSAPQPNAAWSRAQWRPLVDRVRKDSLGPAALDKSRPTVERIRAVQVLGEFHGGVDLSLVAKLADAPAESDWDPDFVPFGETERASRLVLAAALRALTFEEHQVSVALQLLTRVIAPERSPFVRRAAWERIGRLDRRVVSDHQLIEVAFATTGDPHLRNTALWAVRDCRPADRKKLTTYAARLARRRWELARENAAPPTAEQLAELVEIFRKTESRDERLEALRVVQLEMGDVRSEPTRPAVHAGYVGNSPERIPGGPARDALVRALVDAITDPPELGDSIKDPESWPLIRELVRTLGMLGAAEPRLLPRYAFIVDAARQRSVEDFVHLSIALTLLPGERPAELTDAVAYGLLQLHDMLEINGQAPSRNWPVHVGQVFELLSARDPALGKTLVESPRFVRPDQGLFALRLDATLRPIAARKIVDQVATQTDDVDWTADFVELIRTLPADESLPLLREHWNNFLLRDAIAGVLAEHAQVEDRARLVEALGSSQASVVIAAADALRRMPGDATDGEIGEAFRALRQASLDKEAGPTRAALHALLARWAGPAPGPSDADAKPNELVQAWSGRLRRTRRGLVALLDAPGGLDGAAWLQRFESLDWSRGDVERGKLVFEKRSCARCHRAADRLGPDLAGAAGRFSPRDLFVAIVDPSRDVAPLYQASQVVTKSGKVYHGLIVYESPEGTLLQTAPDQTVRVTGDEITGIRKSRQSLMPAGLLQGASDDELLDLHAYLKTLKGK